MLLIPELEVDIGRHRYKTAVKTSQFQAASRQTDTIIVGDVPNSQFPGIFPLESADLSRPAGIGGEIPDNCEARNSLSAVSVPGEVLPITFGHQRWPWRYTNQISSCHV